MYLVFDMVAPKEQPNYVPKRKRKHRDAFSTALLHVLEQGTSIIVERINKMKVRRRLRPLKLRYSGYRPKRKQGKYVSSASLTCMTTKYSNTRGDQLSTFDSDAQMLMLDDGASACITNDAHDFIEPPKRVDKKVKGIKGHARATHRGTVRWYLEDDNGLVHIMVITGAYLITGTTTRILSPQHLAQQANDHYPTAEGTGALTTSKNITLFWAQRRFTKTARWTLRLMWD